MDMSRGVVSPCRRHPVDQFLTRKLNELLKVLEEHVDGLKLPEEIRAAVRLTVSDIRILFENAAARRSETRRPHIAIIEAAGGFKEPRVGLIANKTIFALGEAAFSDQGLAAIADNIGGADSRS